MFLNSNSGKPSLLKPISIIVAILLIVGGVYTFFGKKSESSDNSPSEQPKTQSSGLDQDQKISTVADVEEVLAKWIEANPQAIINSVTNMQRKVMEDQAKNAKQNIAPKQSELLKDKNSPSYSPRGYDVTVVEFFDYNCGYCKKTSPTIESLIDSDSKVRIVYKEFPILGQDSEDMSSVALAVNMVDSSSYRRFHNALMGSGAHSKADALQIASDIGLNVSKIEKTLNSNKSKIADIINANRALGGAIGVNGTPGFVIGEELIPGAIDLATLKAKIADERKK